MSDNSQDTLREAGHQGMDALKNAGHGFADFGHSIADAWGFGAKVRQATMQAASEAGVAIRQELIKENKDLVHGAQVLSENVVHSAQAGANRIGGHIHDRPLTAILEGPFVIVDGLARGGTDKSHDKQPVHNDTKGQSHDRQPAHNNTADKSHDQQPAHNDTKGKSHEAPKAAATKSEHVAHHEVKSGESYWSIAASEGGTNAHTVRRMHQLQEKNHNANLLPGLEIIT